LGERRFLDSAKTTARSERLSSIDAIEDEKSPEGPKIEMDGDRGVHGIRGVSGEEFSMDSVDRKILAILQKDASISIAELASRVNLSQTPCWKRIQKLEKEGVITGRVALLSPEKLGLGLTVFVSVETSDHSKPWLDNFAAVASDMPEVMDFYRMAGDVDYMLRVVVADMAAYDQFYKRLIAAVPLKNVTSRFAMERIKATTAFAIPQPAADKPKRGVAA
jgi:Lrp/AsnC family transcriptional regulator